MINLQERVVIASEIVPKLNFACHQNAFPVLRNLEITNLLSENTLQNLSISLTSNPSFLKSKIWHIDRLSPEDVAIIQDRDIQLNGEFLLNLTESIKGTVTIRIDINGDILAEQTTDIELLSCNEWGGSVYMPELLPAFVTPNLPEVDQILKMASHKLHQAGKDDAINGYRTKSRQRVWEIISAIYSAIVDLKLNYALPPSSFERNGQKIRLPGQILHGGLATCLDSTLLFAAAFEQAGLNPIIVLPKEHALVGIWLQPEEFSTIAIDEAEVLRKRIQLNQLLLFETTFVTQHPSPAFSTAIKAAEDLIKQELDSSFCMAIDVKKARSHQIKPLGLSFSEGTPGFTESESNTIHFEQPLEEAPALPDFDIEPDEQTILETPGGRLERWRRRLLDLTLMNRLLNHKAEKSSLRLFCPNPALLEDRLAAGKKISISPFPKPIGMGQDESLYQRRTGDSISLEYAKNALQKDQVFVNLEENELSSRLVEIYRKTQTDLQEGGANTLYLAIGFLSWKRRAISEDRRFLAPLILLPVALERKSVNNGIKMLIHDDEPRFNTTLLEMLRKDFNLVIPGLDGELPKDESGIDVPGIWNKIRLAIRDVSGFEVVEDVVLGHFSFAKYLMWKDLVDRTEQLKGNAVVAHLIDSPREPYPSPVEFVKPKALDARYAPADLFLPLPADSSQVATVAAAEQGKDFVIFGPPGTGKSQTIANLITHLLGRNKTVLFVSQKPAALEVVYRRLRDIGLAQFCLELHSNKARKIDVLNQLKIAWDSAGEKTEQQWQEESKVLGGLRDCLNKYVSHLHKPYPNGLTPYQAMGVAIRDKEFAESAGLSFSWPSANYHSADDLKAMRQTVKRLGIQAAFIGDLKNSPMTLISRGEWSPEWQNSLVACAMQLSSAAGKALETYQAFCQVVGFSFAQLTFNRLESLAQLSSLMKESYRQQGAFALDIDGAERIEALEQAVVHLKAFIQSQSKLSCAYDSKAWRQLDGDEIGKQWELACTTWWPKSFFAKRAVIGNMKSKGALGNPEPSWDCGILIDLRREGLAIDTLDHTLSSLRIWQKHATEPEKVENLQQLTQKIRSISGQLADDALSLSSIRHSIKSVINEGNDLLAPDAVIGRALEAYAGSLATLKQACATFEESAGCEIVSSFAGNDNILVDIQQMTQSIVGCKDDLKDWCAWRRVRAEAIDLDLKSVVDALENGLLKPGDAPDMFEVAYCSWWTRAVFSGDEVLRAFSSPEHEATIQKFKELDEKFQTTTAHYVAAKLRAMLPSQNNGQNRNAEWGFLQREIQKKRQHKPVRQLMQEIPSVITQLTPCLMMSPISIAQYLPASQSLFDVVIFDEASQITVWDAVGALARGKQVIVAGDPKQMPPSNRFGRKEDDDDDIEHEADLESILDEMLGASIPPYNLNWHYRSRQESLIAFSNYRYYGNTLITFPAPSVSDKGVRLVRVTGEYARGEGRCNEIEAREIVKECVRRLSHPDDTVRKQSIGVVTFNTQQQLLIENLLDAERAKNPAIEWAFSRESITEPVFVKNLDTVQGDERDVILFSITFGPDKSGHITMNFGDLNKQGGERRLNVALTRARSEMLVFSSLSPEQIDLSRTQYAAVADLKHFLEFAAKGSSVLGAAIRGPQGDFESPFEVAVARALQEKGWQVHRQIGVSAYRIDLAVVHPDKPGVYLAGVECDGAMYHSSATAKDRDRIRQAQLENLGWTLYRIWSTDWWVNPKKSLELLEGKLQLRLQQEREQDQHEPDPDFDESNGVLENVPDEDDLENEDESFLLEETIDDENGMDSNGKSWMDYGVEELEGVIVSILQECPKYSCVKGELSSPKQSDLIAKVCRQLGVRTRGTPRKLFAEEVFKAVKKLVSKGVILEYQTSKNRRIRLFSG